MNAFGIDYGRTLSIVSLRDGKGPRARTRLVGDGFRASIPHATSAPSSPPTLEDPLLWGSRALEAKARGGALRPEENLAGLWLERPGAMLFWQGMMQRLTAYVGRVKPLPSNGYDTIIALPSESIEDTSVQLSDLCREAGFEGVTIVPSPHALLCRWMMEVVVMPWGEGAQTVASVSVGDDSISVCAYRVTMRGPNMPQITASSRCFSIPECGSARWGHRLLQEVANRWREMPEIGDEMALRDAANEFGARLSRARQDEQVEWDGPLAERMFENLRLSRRECREWPEVGPLVQELPTLLHQTAHAVNESGRLDLVLVGGVGAMWPFAAEVAASEFRMWQSGFPLEDVARGAAFWPEVGESNLQMLPLDGSAYGSTLTPLSSLPDSEPDTFSSDEFVSAPLEMEDRIIVSTSFSDLPETGESTAQGFEDDAVEETEDEMPPSQRWRAN